MKKSFKIFAVLLAVLVAVAGFNTKAQAEQSSAAQGTANQAAYYSNPGYLVVYAEGGPAFVTYCSLDSGIVATVVNGYGEFAVEPFTTYTVSGLPGYTIVDYSGDSEIMPGQTTTVYITVSMIDGF